ncbi:CHAD domain-containing protein, partial [Burkholderia multivorans]
PRDFGAELVRAWRICPQVRMRRGHERVTIEPCRVVEAEPSPGAKTRVRAATTRVPCAFDSTQVHQLAPG